MIRWRYFLSLTRQVVDGIGWAWPISLFLLLGLALGGHPKPAIDGRLKTGH